MKRVLLALPLLIALSAPAAAAKTHATVAHKSAHIVKKIRKAPADEYFGREKFSILGIRNSLHDVNIRYDGSAYRAPLVFNTGDLLEESMDDWYKKYPGDLWLAHYMFQLDQVYMRVPTDEGHAHVKELSDKIIIEYPNTFYSKYIKRIRVANARTPHAPLPQVASTPITAGLPQSSQSFGTPSAAPTAAPLLEPLAPQRLPAARTSPSPSTGMPNTEW